MLPMIAAGGLPFAKDRLRPNMTGDRRSLIGPLLSFVTGRSVAVWLKRQTSGVGLLPSAGCPPAVSDHAI